MSGTLAVAAGHKTADYRQSKQFKNFQCYANEKKYVVCFLLSLTDTAG